MAQGVLDKIKALSKRRLPRKLTVKSAFNLTKNMRRVTLGGKDLADFPDNSEGTYIKLLFDNPDGKPLMRTYTVSQQRSTENEIDVDFMIHHSYNASRQGTEGIASSWSCKAQPGDTIDIMGPGKATFISLEAEYFLLAGDMTSLPALTANLKTLPEDCLGKVFIEILSNADKQKLPKPEGVELIWVVNDQPGSDDTPLFRAIEETLWPEGRIATWIACEFKTMQKIRHYLKVDRSVDKANIYISSYWKKGNTEEQHKILKKEDAKRASLTK